MQPTEAPVTFDLNGEPVVAQAATTMLLATMLRDRFDMNSVRLGCGEGVCGSCTILIDGKTMRSCLMLAAQAEGRAIMTVEGYAARPPLRAIQTAFVEGFGAQCGFCSSGMLAAVAEYLADASVEDHRDEASIRNALASIVCRCTGYQQIVDIVARLAEEQA